jgi:hypothetical protein
VGAGDGTCYGALPVTATTPHCTHF